MDRLEFLKQKFNVLEEEEYKEKLQEVWGDEVDLEGVEADKDEDTYLIEGRGENQPTYLSTLTFELLKDADPTKNHVNLQWLLGIAISKYKQSLGEFLIFVGEDLPKTKENLILFEANKRKKRFKEFAAKNFATKNLGDPSNILQYTSLDQLYAAVFPFKTMVDTSELENQMINMVNMGEAEMPVKDEFYTVFIPKTLSASELFKFTEWCTAKPENSMFNSYKTNNKKPNGTPSDLYIVIDNKFFLGKSDNIYQIHFESNQLMDMADKRVKNFTHDVINKNISVRNFFYETLNELIVLDYKNWSGSGEVGGFGEKDSLYIKHILNFDFGKLLFDIMDETTKGISFENIRIGVLPDVSRFKNLASVLLDGVELDDINDSLFSSKTLEMLSCPRNNITKLPKSIGNCKNLRFINLLENPIHHIPDSIQYLDPTRGGSLFRLHIPNDFHDIERIRTLLPSVVVGFE